MTTEFTLSLSSEDKISVTKTHIIPQRFPNPRTVSPVVLLFSQALFKAESNEMSTPKSSDTANIPDHPAYSLLARAHDLETASKLYIEKVKQRPLLLHPTKSGTQAAGATSSTDARNQRRLSRLRKKEHFLAKQKPRPLSAKEKRALGIYDIPKEERKYEIYERVHELWVDYMWEILGLKRQTNQQQQRGNMNANPNVDITVAGHGTFLATADYHGAEIEVVRSNCVGRVGAKGIVVRDTKFTFVIITRRNELKTIPKDRNVFRIEIPVPSRENQEGRKSPRANGQEPLRFEIHGEQFQYRPADRANKKFKWQSLENY